MANEGVAETVARMMQPQSHKPCQCPICVTSRSIRAIHAALPDLEAATEAWLEREAEQDGNFHYLSDEVEAVLSMDFADPQARIRLSEAFRITRPERAAVPSPEPSGDTAE